jgi:hypothetical protein
LHVREASRIKRWRDGFPEGAAGVSDAVQKPEAEPTTDVKTPHAKIGELPLRTEIFAWRARQDGSAADAQP